MVNNQIAFEKKHHYVSILQHADEIERELRKNRTPNEDALEQMRLALSAKLMAFAGLVKEGIVDSIVETEEEGEEMVELTIDGETYKLPSHDAFAVLTSGTDALPGLLDVEEKKAEKKISINDFMSKADGDFKSPTSVEKEMLGVMDTVDFTEEANAKNSLVNNIIEMDEADDTDNTKTTNEDIEIDENIEDIENVEEVEDTDDVEYEEVEEGDSPETATGTSNIASLLDDEDEDEDEEEADADEPVDEDPSDDDFQDEADETEDSTDKASLLDEDEEENESEPEEDDVQDLAENNNEAGDAEEPVTTRQSENVKAVEEPTQKAKAPALEVNPSAVETVAVVTMTTAEKSDTTEALSGQTENAETSDDKEDATVNESNNTAEKLSSKILEEDLLYDVAYVSIEKRINKKKTEIIPLQFMIAPLHGQQRNVLEADIVCFGAKVVGDELVDYTYGYGKKDAPAVLTIDGMSFTVTGRFKGGEFETNIDTEEDGELDVKSFRPKERGKDTHIIMTADDVTAHIFPLFPDNDGYLAYLQDESGASQMFSSFDSEEFYAFDEPYSITTHWNDMGYFKTKLEPIVEEPEPEPLEPEPVQHTTKKRLGNKKETTNKKNSKKEEKEKANTSKKENKKEVKKAAPAPTDGAKSTPAIFNSFSFWFIVNALMLAVCVAVILLKMK